jgi:NADPH:quinone reductase-like Zn-dependent oxidoreductase
MMAWRVHEFGSPEIMKFEQVDRPTPGPGEVLVRVGAAGVGPWDAWIRAGKSVLPQPLPLIPGSDLAGRVVTIGPATSDLEVGDEIFGVTNPQFVGAYAEYAVARGSMVARKPKSLSHIAAASVPVVAVTAWQALFNHANLLAGQTVVIHGGAGNVGAYAVQLARRAGARVVTTVGTKEIAAVRRLGAETVIDYKAERFENAIRDADAVIDLVGGDTQLRSFEILRPGGRLISTVSHPDQELAERYGVDARFFLVDVTSDVLSELSRLIDEGEIATNVGTVLPLTKAMDAHRMLEGEIPRPTGKIVLAVGAQGGNGDVPLRNNLDD